MKVDLVYLGICTCLLNCFFFLGCASTPEKDSSEPTTPVTTNLVTDVISVANTNTYTVASIPTNAITQVKAASTNSTTTFTNPHVKTPKAETIKVEAQKVETQKETPQPWDVVYSTKENFVRIDNVFVSLYRKPQKGTNGEAFPHFIDQSTTVDIILNAHTTPIATNRAFRVFIDPGHGGNDPGAINKEKKVYEKTLALDIAKRLQAHLTNAGFITKLSRTDNTTTLTLNERNIMATRWGADIFVSVHINSSSSHIPNGYETYVLANVGQLSTSMDRNQMTSEDWDFVNEKYRGNKNDTRNLLLGYAIHRKVVNNINIADRGLRRARFHVLREATMPAVLVECGYLSSAIDSKYINTTSYRESCARGIYQGIYDYVYGRMQPGLNAAAIPSGKQSSVDMNPLIKPALATNVPPTNINTYKAAEQKPVTQTHVWTPNYTEDSSTMSPELAAARAKALAEAGISFSTKENNKEQPAANNQ